MRRLLIAGALMSSAVAPHNGWAASPIALTYELGLVSDYRFRGISLSNRRPAVQAGVTATLANGVYGGVWASSIEEYGADAGGNGARVELDYTLGWAFHRGGYDIDVGASAYTYPGGHDVNYIEFPVSVSRSLKAATVTLGGAYAPSGQKALGRLDNAYGYGELGWSMNQPELSFVLHAGYEEGAFAPGGKWDWSASVGRDFGTVSGLLTFVASDEKSSSATVVASLLAAF